MCVKSGTFVKSTWKGTLHGEASFTTSSESSRRISAKLPDILRLHYRYAKILRSAEKEMLPKIEALVVTSRSHESFLNMLATVEQRRTIRNNN